MKKVLPKDILKELITELNSTPLASSKQIEEMRKRMPGLAYVNVPDKKISRDVDFVHYPFTNSKLNKLLEGITGMNAEYLLSIHTITSTKGAEVYPHRDTLSAVSLSLILEDEFEGGDFYLNNDYIDLKRAGDYLIFNGHTTSHKVTPISKGSRKVLVAFYKPKASSNIL